MAQIIRNSKLAPSLSYSGYIQQYAPVDMNLAANALGTLQQRHEQNFQDYDTLKTTLARLKGLDAHQGRLNEVISAYENELSKYAEENNNNFIKSRPFLVHMKNQFENDYTKGEMGAYIKTLQNYETAQALAKENNIKQAEDLARDAKYGVGSSIEAGTNGEYAALNARDVWKYKDRNELAALLAKKNPRITKLGAREGGSATTHVKTTKLTLDEITKTTRDLIDSDEQGYKKDFEDLAKINVKEQLEKEGRLAEYYEDPSKFEGAISGEYENLINKEAKALASIFERNDSETTLAGTLPEAPTGSPGGVTKNNLADFQKQNTTGSVFKIGILGGKIQSFDDYKAKYNDTRAAERELAFYDKNPINAANSYAEKAYVNYLKQNSIDEASLSKSEKDGYYQSFREDYHAQMEAKRILVSDVNTVHKNMESLIIKNDANAKAVIDNYYSDETKEKYNKVLQLLKDHNGFETLEEAGRLVNLDGTFAEDVTNFDIPATPEFMKVMSDYSNSIKDYAKLFNDNINGKTDRFNEAFDELYEDGYIKVTPNIRPLDKDNETKKLLEAQYALPEGEEIQTKYTLYDTNGRVTEKHPAKIEVVGAVTDNPNLVLVKGKYLDDKGKETDETHNFLMKAETSVNLVDDVYANDIYNVYKENGKMVNGKYQLFPSLVDNEFIDPKTKQALANIRASKNMALNSQLFYLNPGESKEIMINEVDRDNNSSTYGQNKNIKLGEVRVDRLNEGDSGANAKYTYTSNEFVVNGETIIENATEYRTTKSAIMLKMGVDKYVRDWFSNPTYANSGVTANEVAAFYFTRELGANADPSIAEYVNQYYGGRAINGDIKSLANRIGNVENIIKLNANG